MIRLNKKFIRKDIKTYTPKFKLYCNTCVFQIKKYPQN